MLTNPLFVMVFDLGSLVSQAQMTIAYPSSSIFVTAYELSVQKIFYVNAEFGCLSIRGGNAPCCKAACLVESCFDTMLAGSC